MTVISARGGGAVLLGILLCAPAFGQTPPAAPQAAPRSAQDANKLVCEKQQVLGSRLQTKRVCRTRAEWADLKRQDREYLEKVQTERGMIGQ